MGERVVGGHAVGWVDGETALYEVSCGVGDAAPVFDGGEGVVGDEDGLHFFKVAVAVEGGVTAEEEIGYYADGPDVAVGEKGDKSVMLFTGGHFPKMWWKCRCRYIL